MPAAPADRDSRVGKIIELVVGDLRLLRGADPDTHRTVILGTDVVDVVIGDDVSAVDLPRISAGRLRIGGISELDSIAGNIGELVALNEVVLAPVLQVETGR